MQTVKEVGDEVHVTEYLDGRWLLVQNTLLLYQLMQYS